MSTKVIETDEFNLTTIHNTVLSIFADAYSKNRNIRQKDEFYSGDELNDVVGLLRYMRTVIIAKCNNDIQENEYGDEIDTSWKYNKTVDVITSIIYDIKSNAYRFERENLEWWKHRAIELGHYEPQEEENNE